jgi:hypothetical protein
VEAIGEDHSAIGANDVGVPFNQIRRISSAVGADQACSLV